MFLNLRLVCLFFLSNFPLFGSNNIVIIKPQYLEIDKEELFVASAISASDEIAKNILSESSFEEILSQAIRWRRDLEKKLNKNGWSYLGLRREKYSFKFYTNLKDLPVSNGLEKARELLEQGEKNIYLFETLDASFPFEVYTFLGKFKDLVIPLTKVIGYPGYLYRKNSSLLQIFGKDFQEPIVFEHTQEKELPKIHPILKELYEDCVKSSKIELFERLGYFYWWFVHSKPFIRGSNSIVRILILSILKARGEYCTCKKGLFPQYEALLESNPEVFGRNFISFFEWEKNYG